MPVNLSAFKDGRKETGASSGVNLSAFKGTTDPKPTLPPNPAGIERNLNAGFRALNDILGMASKGSQPQPDPNIDAFGLPKASIGNVSPGTKIKKISTVETIRNQQKAEEAVYPDKFSTAIRLPLAKENTFRISNADPLNKNLATIGARIVEIPGLIITKGVDFIRKNLNSIISGKPVETPSSKTLLGISTKRFGIQDEMLKDTGTAFLEAVDKYERENPSRGNKAKQAVNGLKAYSTTILPDALDALFFPDVTKGLFKAGVDTLRVTARQLPESLLFKITEQRVSPQAIKDVLIGGTRVSTEQEFQMARNFINGLSSTERAQMYRLAQSYEKMGLSVPAGGSIEPTALGVFSRAKAPTIQAPSEISGLLSSGRLNSQAGVLNLGAAGEEILSLARKARDIEEFKQLLTKEQTALLVARGIAAETIFNTKRADLPPLPKIKLKQLPGEVDTIAGGSGIIPNAPKAGELVIEGVASGIAKEFIPKSPDAESFIKERGLDPDSVMITDSKNFIVENTAGNEAVLMDVPLEKFGEPKFETLNQSKYEPGRAITDPIEATLMEDGSFVITDGANRFTQAMANGDKTIPVIVEIGKGKNSSRVIQAQEAIPAQIPALKDSPLREAIIEYKMSPADPIDRGIMAKNIVELADKNPEVAEKIASLARAETEKYLGKTIYRAGGVRGMSWTFDEDVAEAMAGGGESVIHQQEFTKELLDRVIFYDGIPEAKLGFKWKDYEDGFVQFPFQSESEILILPKGIKSPIKNSAIKPKTSEAVATRYWDEVISKRIEEGKSVVIGADDLKDFFGGDYNDLRHPIYSKAAFQLYERALKEVENSLVIFTGGGPASGKTEFLIKNLDDFTGIIYDSNMASIEGIRNQVNAAKKAGKEVEVYGIIPNLERARAHSLMREDVKGRGISDKTFTKNHVGFVRAMNQALDEGTLKPDQVNIFDLRDVKTKEDAIAMVENGNIVKNPVDFLNGLNYNEIEIASNYAKANYQQTSKGTYEKPASSSGSREVSSVNRADSGRQAEIETGKEVVNANDASGLQESLQLPGGSGADSARKTVPAGATRPEASGNTRQSPQVRESAEELGKKYEIRNAERRDFQAEKKKPKPIAEIIDEPLAKPELMTKEDFDEVRDAGSDHIDRLIEGKFHLLKPTGELSDWKEALGQVSDTLYPKIFRSTPFLQRTNKKLLRPDEYAGQFDMTEDELRNAIVERAEKRIEDLKFRQSLPSLKQIEKQMGRARTEAERKAAKVSKEVLDKMAKQYKRAIGDLKRGNPLTKRIVKTEADFLKDKLRTEQAAARRAVMEKVKEIKTREGKVAFIENTFKLKTQDFQALLGRRNFRYMEEKDFENFLEELYGRARAQMEKDHLIFKLKTTIKEKQLRKVENLQKAMKLPTFENMSPQQLKDFSELMSTFQYKDEFLSTRKLETVANTDLAGIKTLREAREILAEKLGVPVIELEGVRSKESDIFRWDTALAEKNPFYRLVVERVSKSFLNAEAKNLKIEKEIERLFIDARKSRGFMERLKKAFIPTDERIFKYLESSDKEVLAKDMTPEELKAAEYVRGKYQQIYDALAVRDSMKKMGYRENYVTHIRRGFLETWKDDGIMRAFREVLDKRIQDEAIFTILDEKTGDVMPLEKFFQFSLRRSGLIVPTKNVARAFLSYVKAFNKKVSLDEIVPEIQIYTAAISPMNLTQGGLEMDPSLKQFINKFLNTKKGRPEKQIFKPGGKYDSLIKMAQGFTYMIDLGLKIPLGIGSQLGERTGNYIMLGAKKYTVGRARSFTKQGRELVKRYENFIGRSPWESFHDATKGVLEKAYEGLFALFKDSAMRANRHFFLSSLTQKEFDSGIVSAERLAQLKIEMGRFRVVDGSTSVFGASTIGRVVSQYRRWAIVNVRTTLQNLKNLSKIIRDNPKSIASSREFQETLRSSIVLAITSLIILMAVDDDPKDDTFIQKVFRKMTQDAMSVASSFGSTLFTPFRLQGFIEDLYNALKDTLNVSRYKTTGELKGPAELYRTLVPSVIRDVIPGKSNKRQKGKTGIPTLPKLPALPKLPPLPHL